MKICSGRHTTLTVHFVRCQQPVAQKLISGSIEVHYGWPGFFYFLSALSVVAGVLYGISSEVTQLEKEKIALLSTALMAFVTYSYSTYLILFLVLGTGAATAWTSLNTMAVQVSVSLRKPVTSVYNAIKFTGYALSPMILSIIYGPFQLRAVQFGCMGAIIISSFLASRAKVQSNEA